MEKMSSQQIKSAVSYVTATSAIEGMKPSRSTIENGKKYLQGTMSSADAIRSITEKILIKKANL